MKQTNTSSAEPKRAKNAYMFFTQAHREQVSSANPEMKQTEVAKQLGAQWKALSAEERAPYEKQATDDKARWDAACDALGYVPKRKGKSRDESPKRGKKSKRDPKAPKKPSSAYLCYSNAMRATVKQEMPQLDAKGIMSELGKRWRELDDRAKEPYQQLAAQDKQRYETEMASYEPSLVL